MMAPPESVFFGDSASIDCLLPPGVVPGTSVECEVGAKVGCELGLDTDDVVAEDIVAGA